MQKYIAEWVIKYGDFIDLKKYVSSLHNTEKISNIKGPKKIGTK